MIIYELCFIVFIFLIISIIITRDIFSPASLICESYIFALICAIYNINNWGLSLNSSTFYIIILGLLAFLIPSFFLSLINYKKNQFSQKKEGIKQLKLLNFPKNIVIFLNIINFIIFFLYIIFFYKALKSLPVTGSFSYKMEVYRELTQFEGKEYIPSIINLLSKFCRAFAYVSMYILVNNLLYSLKNNLKYRNKIIYLIPIIIYIPLSLTSGARFDLIIYIITSAFMYIILYRRAYHRNLKTKKLLKMVILVFMVLLLFSASRTLVGRTSKSDPITYITTYFGGSIACFDMYLQDYPNEDITRGEELFYGFNKLMVQLHLKDNLSEKSSMKFRVSNTGVLIGNIYTGFRKMHHDYGKIGIVAFQVLLSIIFNKMYYSILNYKESKYGLDFRIILYCSLIYCLVLHSFSEFFFSTVISFNYIALFIIIIFIRYFLYHVRLKKGGKVLNG